MKKKRSIAELHQNGDKNTNPNANTCAITSLDALDEDLYWKVPKVTADDDLTLSDIESENGHFDRAATVLDLDDMLLPSIVTNETYFPIRAVSILQPKLFSFCSAFSASHQSSTCFAESLLSLTGSKEVIFFDTETTGIYKYDRIIEVAFVYRNYETMLERRLYSLINPQGKKSSRGAIKVHKIPNESLTSQRSFAQMIDEIMEFIGDTITLIAHNASFDRMMLNQELSKLHRSLLPKGRFICTYQLAVKLRGRVKGLNSLDQLCKDYGIDSSSRSVYHGAMQDTLLLGDLYPVLVVDSTAMEE